MAKTISLLVIAGLSICPNGFSDTLYGKMGCPALLDALYEGTATKTSYTGRPEEFSRIVQSEVDPKRELDALKSQEKNIYGEFFDGKDIDHVFKKLKEWNLVETLSNAQKDKLANYIVLRAHGLKKAKDADLQRELADMGITFKVKGQDVTVEALDLAIADAGAVENSKKIRVYPKSLAEKASNDALPQATVVFHGNAKGKEAGLGLETIEKDRNRVAELRKSGDGVLLIGDLHLYRGDKENQAFSNLLSELKDHAPKKLILGGDIVDAIGIEKREIPKLAGEVAETGILPSNIQNELNTLAARLAKKEELPEVLREPEVRLKPGVSPPQFTDESAAKIRFALTILQLKRIKEALPNTEVSFIVGNHDVPRMEFLTREGSDESVSYRSANKENKTLKLPHILALERGELKKETLFSALADANPGLTPETIRAESSAWFPKLKQAFQIKGSSVANLKDHRHYDLAFASWFTQRGRDFGVTTLITNPAAPVQIGDNAIVHEPILLTRDTEKTPNLLRLVEPLDNPYGVQPEMSDFTRRVINFDQHVSASIRRDDPSGRSFTNILVGAFSASNANPGQRYSASVIDPKTGEVYPVTFFNSRKYFQDPEGLGVGPYSLAPTTRLNYETPTAYKKGA